MNTYLLNTKKAIHLTANVFIIFLGFIFLVVGGFFTNVSKLKNDLFYMFNLENINSICCVVSNMDSYNGVYTNLKGDLLNYEQQMFKKIISNGSKSFLYIDKSNFFDENFNLILKSDYIELKTDNFDYIEKTLLKFNAKKVLSEAVAGNAVEYFYVPFLKKYKLVNGVKINLQIVLGQESCVVGYPMVYSSY